MRAAGFTLIEVLVALAIVVIGMAAVLGALSSSANTVLYLRDKTFAEWVALNHIANVRLPLQAQQLPPTGNTTGEVEYAGRSWHWRQEVVASQVKGMVRIDVKVRPADIKAGEDDGWFTTVSGIAGDALAPPTGTTPLWGGAQRDPGQPAANTLGGGAPAAPSFAPSPAASPQNLTEPPRPAGGVLSPQ